ncbi:hypothetical protein N9E76_00790 [bacterium]|nr:hypothetical protein [bacterium]
MNNEAENLFMAIKKLKMDIKSFSSQDTDTEKIFKQIETEAKSLQERRARLRFINWNLRQKLEELEEKIGDNLVDTNK